MHIYLIIVLSVISLIFILSSHFVRPMNRPRLVVAAIFALMPWLLHFHSIAFAFAAALIFAITSIVLFVVLAS